MEELVALIFTFCISPTALPNQDDKETLVRCNTYVTDCVIDIKSHWTKKDLERCEQEGLSTNWEHKE